MKTSAARYFKLPLESRPGSCRPASGALGTGGKGRGHFSSSAHLGSCRVTLRHVPTALLKLKCNCHWKTPVSRWRGVTDGGERGREVSACPAPPAVGTARLGRRRARSGQSCADGRRRPLPSATSRTTADIDFLTSMAREKTIYILPFFLKA